MDFDVLVSFQRIISFKTVPKYAVPQAHTRVCTIEEEPMDKPHASKGDHDVQKLLTRIAELSDENIRLRRHLTELEQMPPTVNGGLKKNMHSAARLPKLDDHVIAFHAKTRSYYSATVANFDSATATFTVKRRKFRM